MEVELARQHRGCSTPLPTGCESVLMTDAASTNLPELRKCIGCFVQTAESDRFSAQSLMLASLNRDCELRHVYLKDRWQGR